MQPGAPNRFAARARLFDPSKKQVVAGYFVGLGTSVLVYGAGRYYLIAWQLGKGFFVVNKLGVSMFVAFMTVHTAIAWYSLVT